MNSPHTHCRENKELSRWKNERLKSPDRPNVEGDAEFAFAALNAIGKVLEIRDVVSWLGRRPVPNPSEPKLCTVKTGYLRIEPHLVELIL